MQLCRELFAAASQGHLELKLILYCSRLTVLKIESIYQVPQLERLEVGRT